MVLKTLLRRFDKQPVVYFPAAGALMALAILSGFWGPVSDALSDGYQAEKQRLLEAFSHPLSKALVMGDDLACADELRRLQSLPGILSVKIARSVERSSSSGGALIWEGKALGQLDIDLSTSRLARWRYHCVERGWALLMGAALFGIGIGSVYCRWRGDLLDRVVETLRRWHKRHRRRRDMIQKGTEQNVLALTRQAMALTSKALVLLDGRQRIMAINPKAEELFNLSIESVGSHWLQLTPSPGWASALQQTLEDPGKLVAAPPKDSHPLKLLTLSNPGSAHGVTWIIHEPLLV